MSALLSRIIRDAAELMEPGVTRADFFAFIFVFSWFAIYRFTDKDDRDMFVKFGCAIIAVVLTAIVFGISTALNHFGSF